MQASPLFATLTRNLPAMHRLITIILSIAATLAGGPVAAQSDYAAVADYIRAWSETTAEPVHTRVTGQRLHRRDKLLQIYAERAYQPIWNWQPHTPLAELVRVIEHAPDEGLDPESYHLTAIKAGLAALQQPVQGSARAKGLADVDLLLSDAFVTYADHMLRGRIRPQAIDDQWIATPRRVNYALLLRSALGGGGVVATLSALAPPHEGYRRLRQALKIYRALQRAGGLPQVPAGPTLHKGDNGPRVQALRARLAASAELPHTALSSELFDDALELAVKRFQGRLGLDPDGAVGRKTLRSLNMSAADRVQQIELNMERWRWQPETFGERYVRVNVTEYTLDVVEQDKTLMSMRVIVGKPYKRTPVFSAKMTYLVLNPYWQVPPSIAREEILPKLRHDLSYLEEDHMKVLLGWGADQVEVDPTMVDWQSIRGSRLPFHFRADPGPENPLGRVKFMFPNRFNVYLHDTPSRNLFARTVREFSHGCIRIQKPMELAHYLLANDPRWPPERVRFILDEQITKTVPLAHPIMVYVQYWTAWVDADGTVHFREDNYGRDETLRRALEQVRQS